MKRLRLAHAAVFLAALVLAACAASTRPDVFTDGADGGCDATSSC